VFLENEIEAFAAQHADYPREKFVDIIRKTWKKMSPRGQALAKTIALPPAIGALVGEAIGGA
jgi:tRNAThr (cytosine32-N3)-methyltransferase